MSLQPAHTYIVPEPTARIAHAALPKGALCLQLYDHLGTLFQEQDFAELLPRREPAAAPFRLALVTVLQCVEGRSDRAAADAVRGRLDWQYLLCLALDDPGFDQSVVCEFRARLLTTGAERRLLAQLVVRLRVPRRVTAQGRARTDSTEVGAAIRTMNRLERVVETLRAALNILATVVPEGVQAPRPMAWLDQ